MLHFRVLLGGDDTVYVNCGLRIHLLLNQFLAKTTLPDKHSMTQPTENIGKRGSPCDAYIQGASTLEHIHGGQGETARSW